MYKTLLSPNPSLTHMKNKFCYITGEVLKSIVVVTCLTVGQPYVRIQNLVNLFGGFIQCLSKYL